MLGPVSWPVLYSGGLQQTSPQHVAPMCDDMPPPSSSPSSVQVNAVRFLWYVHLFVVLRFIFYSCTRSYLCDIYSPSPFALCSDATCCRLAFASPPLAFAFASLSLHSTCDVSACPWDMPTKVEGGEFAVGMVKSARARMWRGVRQSEGVQEEHEGVQGSVQGGVQGSVQGGVQGSAREHGEHEEA